MQKNLRKEFNAQFTEEKYNAYLKDVEAIHEGSLDFRNAETPIFISKEFKNQMLEACEAIIDVIIAPDFKEKTENAIPGHLRMSGENKYPEFLVFDFGICENKTGELEPQLIEMQGFPSLFAFQVYHGELTAKYANMPANYSPYLNGYNKETYIQLFKNILIGDCDADEVILLEIFPEKQKTRIDFYATQKLLGIKFVCLTKLKAEGNKLFYIKDDGQKQFIKRIYNRIIFDDIESQEEKIEYIDLNIDYEVEWMTHPHWFYRVSKYTLPLIKHKNIPETFFLNEIKTMPTDLENYVLKPLFSFAGQGVIIDVTLEDINKVTDTHNWILQRKVKYANAIETLDEPAKAEVRLFYFWPKGAKRPVGVNNLGRLSKGKMIGTRYNKDKTWVGGSVCFFEN